MHTRKLAQTGATRTSYIIGKHNLCNATSVARVQTSNDGKDLERNMLTARVHARSGHVAACHPSGFDMSSKHLTYRSCMFRVGFGALCSAAARRQKRRATHGLRRQRWPGVQVEKHNECLPPTSTGPNRPKQQHLGCLNISLLRDAADAFWTMSTHSGDDLDGLRYCFIAAAADFPVSRHQARLPQPAELAHSSFGHPLQHHHWWTC